MCASTLCTRHPATATQVCTCREVPIILTMDAAATHALDPLPAKCQRRLVSLTDHVPPGDLSGLAQLGQDLNVTVCSMHADPLPIPDQTGGMLDPHDGRQAVLPCDHRAMGHQAAHLRHQALERDKQGCPARVSVGGDQDVARFEV